MEVINYKDYRFLQVCESPNIVISLKSEKQFCELDEEVKPIIQKELYTIIILYT